MRMDEEIASAFVDYGVDVMNIAIDGATAETYGRIRKELKLDVVEANVRRLIKMRNAARKNRPFIMVHMIHMAENAHDLCRGCNEPRNPPAWFWKPDA